MQSEFLIFIINLWNSGLTTTKITDYYGDKHTQIPPNCSYNYSLSSQIASTCTDYDL